MFQLESGEHHPTVPTPLIYYVRNHGKSLEIEIKLFHQRREDSSRISPRKSLKIVSTQERLVLSQFLWWDRNPCEDLQISQSLSISGFSFPFVC